MKIKVTDLSYEEAIKKEWQHHNPVMPSLLLKVIINLISKSELKAVGFSYESQNMDKLSDNEPCLILMNHSSFIDLKIAEHIFNKRPLSIVCTSDGFIGKEWLMRHLGCIPTQKFVQDLQLIKDLDYALHTLKSSVLMYPEASYSFDGTATPLPNSVAKCIKLLKVPVVMIRTHGAFLRDPLYNNLQLRDVKVTAEVKYLLSTEDIAELTANEIAEILLNEFSFDNFKEQQDNKISVKEPFRADYLNRVLYKCPHCMTEGKMEGKGTKLTCNMCHVTYELNEFGYLESEEPRFTHIPDWYKWQREDVKKEIEDGNYNLDVDVDICVLTDAKSIYRVGEGHLHHDINGFRLTGCDGKLDYMQSPQASYSLYSDYYWYEIGDMICIGNKKILYYCFPKDKSIDIAAKTRLAVEELYKAKRTDAPLCVAAFAQ